MRKQIWSCVAQIGFHWSVALWLSSLGVVFWAQVCAVSGTILIAEIIYHLSQRFGAFGVPER